MQSREEILARLNEYRKAELSVLKAQKYEVEDKMLEKADLKYIQAMIKELESQLSGTNPNVKRMRTQRVLHKRY